MDKNFNRISPGDSDNFGLHVSQSWFLYILYGSYDITYVDLCRPSVGAPAVGVPWVVLNVEKQPKKSDSTKAETLYFASCFNFFIRRVQILI